MFAWLSELALVGYTRQVTTMLCSGHCHLYHGIPKVLYIEIIPCILENTGFFFSYWFFSLQIDMCLSCFQNLIRPIDLTRQAGYVRRPVMHPRVSKIRLICSG